MNMPEFNGLQRINDKIKYNEKEAAALNFDSEPIKMTGRYGNFSENFEEIDFYSEEPDTKVLGVSANLDNNNDKITDAQLEKFNTETLKAIKSKKSKKAIEAVQKRLETNYEHNGKKLSVTDIFDKLSDTDDFEKAAKDFTNETGIPIDLAYYGQHRNGYSGINIKIGDEWIIDYDLKNELYVARFDKDNKYITNKPFKGKPINLIKGRMDELYGIELGIAGKNNYKPTQYLDRNSKTSVSFNYGNNERYAGGMGSKAYDKYPQYPTEANIELSDKPKETIKFS